MARSSFRLLDASALVVGYGLASMLIRAYWPDTSTPSFWETVFILLVFAWLGLAMSGPVVLLIRRNPRRVEDSDVGDVPHSEPRTWAELAWLMIGFYWIGLTILVVPVRMQTSPFLDSAILGIFPVLAALALRFFGPPAMRKPGGPAWTQRAGVVLLITWPFAWVALILLGKNL